MKLRTMHMQDYDALIACWQEQSGITLNDCDTPEGMRRFLERNPGLSVIAEEDGHIIGTLMCGHDGRRGYLHHMWTDPDQRGRGIARQLFEHCIQQLEAIAIHKAHLFVLIDNHAAQKFWKSVGCEERTNIKIFSYTSAMVCAS